MVLLYKQIGKTFIREVYPIIIMNPLTPLTTLQRSIGVAQEKLNQALRYVPIITLSLSLPFVPSFAKATSLNNSKMDSDDVVTYEVEEMDHPDSLFHPYSFQPNTPMLDTVWVTAPRLEERVNVSPKIRVDTDSLRIHYEPKAREAARKAGIDPLLYSILVETESSWDPKAHSYRETKKDGIVSIDTLGIGLSQMSPAAAKDVAKDIGLGPHNAYEVIKTDPIKNLEAGAFYLRRLIARYDGDVRLALAEYNAGRTAVLKYGGIPPFKQTLAYVHGIMDKLDRYKRRAV